VDQRPNDAHDARPERADDLYRYAGSGLQLAVTVAVFGALGYLVDPRLGTLPLFLLVGMLLGFALAAYTLVRQFSTQKATKKDEEPRER